MGLLTEFYGRSQLFSHTFFPLRKAFILVLDYQATLIKYMYVCMYVCMYLWRATILEMIFLKEITNPEHFFKSLPARRESSPVSPGGRISTRGALEKKNCTNSHKKRVAVGFFNAPLFYCSCTTLGAVSKDRHTPWPYVIQTCNSLIVS